MGNINQFKMKNTCRTWFKISDEEFSDIKSKKFDWIFQFEMALPWKKTVRLLFMGVCYEKVIFALKS